MERVAVSAACRKPHRLLAFDDLEVEHAISVEGTEIDRFFELVAKSLPKACTSRLMSSLPCRTKSTDQIS